MDRIITPRDLIERPVFDIKNRIVAIVGYGNQGRSQALNLRDSGFNIIVGNIDDKYALEAKRDGFTTFEIRDAVSKSDIIFILIPDELQQKVFENEITPFLKKGQTIVFASGYNVYYNLLQIPNFVAVLMIAPRMIGWGVREMFLKREGFPVLTAVGNDPYGEGEDVALELAKGIGALGKNGCLIKSSFKEETLLDLLSEHTWAGAILFLFRTYYDVATNLGASPEATILELYGSGELAEIAQSMKEMGLFEQLKTHSKTSQYGQLTRGPEFATEDVKQIIEQEAAKIVDGTFAREWADEQKDGKRVYDLLKMNLEHPMVLEEKKLYKILGRVQ
ncbi:MAG: ketol-acid reductoisomerase [Candidatus Thermoplasmatota archaeon]|jgi:ketol-acid reductoisomerase|nr:ketol-acid reductoisomerase [Candidatus Thermoplasmatota archaeon]